MDSKQFDELVARLASTPSRRDALKGVVGGALAAAGVSAVDDAEVQGKKGKKKVGSEHCLAVGERCSPPKNLKHGKKRRVHTCNNCCSRFSEAAEDGKRRCACRSERSQCTQNRQCCSQRCNIRTGQTQGTCQY